MEEDMTYDYGDDDGVDWFYVEDEVALADELAETQIAEPGYAGTSAEIAMESFEYDLYEYWDDLEYGLDTYWDGKATGAGRQGESNKRKREKAKRGERTDKRRRLGLEDVIGIGVVYVSLAERTRIFKKRPAVVSGREPWALLPDWRTRFAGNNEPVADRAMPSEMRLAAEAGNNDTPQRKSNPHPDILVDAETSDGGDHNMDVSDEDGEDDEGLAGENDEGSDGVLDIDPEMLKAVLRERLGSGGLNGLEESEFMQAIETILSGGGDIGAAIAELAETLLNQTTEDANGAQAQWLTQQGVSLPQEQEGDDTTELESEPGGSAGYRSHWPQLDGASGKAPSGNAKLHNGYSKPKPSEQIDETTTPSGADPTVNGRGSLAGTQSSTTASRKRKARASDVETQAIDDENSIHKRHNNGQAASEPDTEPPKRTERARAAKAPPKASKKAKR